MRQQQRTDVRFKPYPKVLSKEWFKMYFNLFIRRQ